MSIVWKPLTDRPPANDEDDSVGAWDSLYYFVYSPLAASGVICWFCGGDLENYPIVHWHGTGGDLFVHPQCAGNLGQHLIKDGMIAAHPEWIRSTVRHLP